MRAARALLCSGSDRARGTVWHREENTMRTMGLLMAMLAAGCMSHTRTGDDAGPPVGDAGPEEDAGPLGCTLREPEQHRASAEACPMDRPASSVTDGMGQCSSDSDCTEGINGRCYNSRFETVCSYDTCFSDSECGDSACICRGGSGGVGSFGANRCIGGGCQTDSDCGAGGFCSPSFGDCGDFGGTVGYFCRTCEDECLNDSDCTEETGPFGGGGYCAFNPAVGHWACSYSQCAG